MSGLSNYVASEVFERFNKSFLERVAGRIVGFVEYQRGFAILVQAKSSHKDKILIDPKNSLNAVMFKCFGTKKSIDDAGIAIPGLSSFYDENGDKITGLDMPMYIYHPHYSHEHIQNQILLKSAKLECSKCGEMVAYLEAGMTPSGFEIVVGATYHSSSCRKCSPQESGFEIVEMREFKIEVKHE
jgi:hypothetical protein